MWIVIEYVSDLTRAMPGRPLGLTANRLFLGPGGQGMTVDAALELVVRGSEKHPERWYTTRKADAAEDL